MRQRNVFKNVLNIDIESINEAHKPSEKGFCMGDTTYRHDGFSIGNNYLRLEGRTLMRGDLLPKSLCMDKTIGEGAFSKVYKGRWSQKEKTVDVAVKQFCLLESSPQRREMLIKELKALCRIDCVHLVRLQGAFLENDAVTMVLEFMDRGSLEQLLRQKPGGALSEPFVASVAYQMLLGLSYLHKERIIHRDIKVRSLNSRCHNLLQQL